MTDWNQRAIDSVRAGTPDVEAIYMAYREPMLGTAVDKLGGVDNSTLGLSAEDVVIEVVTGLIDGSIGLDPSVADHLKARLRRIVANRAIDLMRRRGAESRARVKQHPTDLTDTEADVETMVLAGQAEERMFVLNEREHYVIVEHVKKGRLVKDVADELVCTPQNVSQLKKAALRKLFAALPFAEPNSNDQE
ncbi:MAG: sigma-70 family RNA polymerase sigma factor [Actinomycetota bacterium]|nr:sigma-70 family RNA polymerase sigma factor [Actinomycetota bacterium]